MAIKVHVNVVTTIEYDKVIEFENLSDFKRYLDKIEYNTTQGMYNVTKVKNASSITANSCDKLNYDEVGEVYILTPSGVDVEIFDFLRVREETA